MQIMVYLEKILFAGYFSEISLGRWTVYVQFLM